MHFNFAHLQRRSRIKKHLVVRVYSVKTERYCDKLHRDLRKSNFTEHSYAEFLILLTDQWKGASIQNDRTSPFYCVQIRFQR